MAAGVSYPGVELDVIRWAEARQIIPYQRPETALLKCMSELGELADATIKGSKEEIIDGVGDVVVTLIVYCALQDIDLTTCLKSAYQEINNRKGTMLPNGVFVKEPGASS